MPNVEIYFFIGYTVSPVANLFWILKTGSFNTLETHQPRKRTGLCTTLSSLAVKDNIKKRTILHRLITESYGLYNMDYNDRLLQLLMSLAFYEFKKVKNVLFECFKKITLSYIQSNSVITYSSGPAIIVRYNRGSL